MIEKTPAKVAGELSRMDQPAYRPDFQRRQMVLAALVDRCIERGWDLLAAHVRSNHVHLVVEGEAAPERMMNDLKSFASRRLNQAGLDSRERRRWARHESTRWLWKAERLSAAIQYVIDKQGEKMAVYEKRPLPMVAAR
jgi:REP element-mobilizing transposase RayT